jgi:hypothetical protein
LSLAATTAAINARFEAVADRTRPAADTSKPKPAKFCNLKRWNMLPPGHVYTKYEQTILKPRVKAAGFVA